MAGLSTKDIKLRIKSMESTKQITKAMEMVAASKLRRAQERALESRPYFEILYNTYTDIAEKNRVFDSPYFQEREAKNICYVVIAGDRGLAGGYNSNVLKLAFSQIENQAGYVLPIGKKAVEFFRHHHVPLLTETYAEAASVSIGDCFTIANLLAKDFKEKKYDRICIAYTNFLSVLSQTPVALQLLPVPKTSIRTDTHAEGAQSPAKSHGLILYEPGFESVLNAVIPEYLGGVIYGALCESVASELGARRTAMDSATKNAEDMIEDLNLKYNRARQGAITQEITEIVAGSEN